MKILRVLCLGLWSQAFMLSYYLASCEQQPLNYQTRLRNATLEDADDIATIIITAFSSMPSWQYVYQFRQDFPEEHQRCVRYGVIQGLSDPDMHMEVIQAPVNSGIALIAVAAWRQGHLSLQVPLYSVSKGKCTHRDINVTRALDFERKFKVEKRRHLDHIFGKNQLYLDLLGTHPQYQGRGAGTELVKSGIERGRRGNVNVTLIAQPTAETFYLSLGFTSTVNISVTSIDNDQSFRFPVMAYNFD